MKEPLFSVKGLNKHFGPTWANRNIDFELHRGEIRGFIGENGSGKSTLLSQIAGIYPPDSGEMQMEGKKYAPQGPLDAYKVRISMVLQELGVIGTLPVAANIFLGRTRQFARFGLVGKSKMRKASEEIFRKWEMPLPDFGANIGSMLIEDRKMIELARALSVDPDILLLDEVTQSLSLNNREILYKIIKRLKAEDRSVIMITHDVDEILAVTDTVTVLRDGEVVGTVASSEATPTMIRQMMVGRSMDGDYYRNDRIADFDVKKVVLKADHISVAGELSDVDFELHEGEILGFCGLSDSGIHSVGKAVYGLSRLSSGSVVLTEEGKKIHSSREALENQMGYVPKDRDAEAIMINDSIRENVALPSFTELEGAVGYISSARMKSLAEEVIEQMSVKCTGCMQTVGDLSGGNKQKINLGRWLAKDLKVLVLDCPTRGVDVGVKAYIYQVMKEAKKRGLAMILISDELTEVIGMADRLMVMKDGRVTRTISREGDFTEQAVIEVMI